MAKPAVLGKAVPLVKGDAAGVQRGDRGQQVADAPLCALLFQVRQQPAADPSAGVVRN